jgi:hypothetical protein
MGASAAGWLTHWPQSRSGHTANHFTLKSETVKSDEDDQIAGWSLEVLSRLFVVIGERAWPECFAETDPVRAVGLNDVADSQRRGQVVAAAGSAIRVFSKSSVSIEQVCGTPLHGSSSRSGCSPTP